jgi:hypothetical protein
MRELTGDANTGAKTVDTCRCELWGFIREINSGIFTYEIRKYQFFPPELLLHNYKCGGLCPLLYYSEYTYNCKLKKILRNVIDDFNT